MNNNQNYDHAADQLKNLQSNPYQAYNNGCSIF